MKSKNIYRIPIEPSAVEYVVTDSPGHKVYRSGEETFDGTNAIDFLCEIGTPVKAGLEGKVVRIFNGVAKNWHKEEEPPADYMGSMEQDGNYVVLEHPNGEFSIYSHLQKDKLLVSEGDVVKIGQKIGLSGNTGWSIKPHVHMMVHDFPHENKGGYRSLVPRFDTKSARVIKSKLIPHGKLKKQNA